MRNSVGFADLYGPPASGPSVSAGTNPSKGSIGGAAGKITGVTGTGFPMELPALIVLGIVAWWLWQTYD